MGQAESDFVGRENEMATLLSALQALDAGQGRLLMLVGPPGIGKTRIAQEIVACAQHLGALTLWGRCPEERGAPPYWPWTQTIRLYIAGRDAQTLRQEMGDGAVFIAEMVPELRSKLPNLRPAPTLEPEQARFRLFDAILAFLKNASVARPLMIILDDLHWADAASLRLLSFLAFQQRSSRLFQQRSSRLNPSQPGQSPPAAPAAARGVARAVENAV